MSAATARVWAIGTVVFGVSHSGLDPRFSHHRLGRGMFKVSDVVKASRLVVGIVSLGNTSIVRGHVNPGPFIPSSPDFPLFEFPLLPPRRDEFISGI